MPNKAVAAVITAALTLTTIGAGTASAQTSPFTRCQTVTFYTTARGYPGFRCTSSLWWSATHYLRR